MVICTIFILMGKYAITRINYHGEKSEKTNAQNAQICENCVSLQLFHQRWNNIMDIGVFWRLGFDVLELRNFERLVKNKATGTPLGVFIDSPYRIWTVHWTDLWRVGIAITFFVGLSSLFVSTNRAMRRPQHVERATGLAPRFLCPVI